MGARDQCAPLGGWLMNELAHIEHKRWLELVEHLESNEVVTKEECASSPSRRDTYGTKLFHLIRRWAHSYADLREAEPKVRENEEVDL